MPDTLLRNQSFFAGEYNGEELDVVSTVVTTKFVAGLVANKVADLDVWAGDGYLTYTISITNTADHDYTDVVFHDVLDTSKIDFVPNTVFMNLTPVTAYTYTASELSFPVGTIAIGETVVITFQVKKNV